MVIMSSEADKQDATWRTCIRSCAVRSDPPGAVMATLTYRTGSMGEEADTRRGLPRARRGRPRRRHARPPSFRYLETI